MRRLTFSQDLNHPTPEIAKWHFSPGAFQRLSPPWMNIRIMGRESPVKDGRRSTFRLRLPFGPRIQWTAEYHHCDPDSGFTDVQIDGPFKQWRHRHSFGHGGVNDDLCRLEDVIEYQLPFAPISHWIAGSFTDSELRRTFNYRHRILKADLDRRACIPDSTPWHILITGASGLVGQQLKAFLSLLGHRVTSVSRTNPHNSKNIVTWNISRDEFDLSDVDPIDAVIHLAGASVAESRWTGARREMILKSRVRTAHLLVRELLKRNNHPVKSCVFASGTSCYTPDGEEKPELAPLDTSTFLGNIVDQWEASADPFREAGIRTTHLRLGAVLTPSGGVLEKLLPILKTGFGGHVGKGSQNFPWISIDDAVDLFLRATFDERYHGSYNAIAPQLVSNAKFTATLAKVLRRPAILPVPGLALRIVLGQMANEILIQNMVPIPHRLKAELNYDFRHAELEPALRHLLGRY